MTSAEEVERIASELDGWLLFRQAALLRTLLKERDEALKEIEAMNHDLDRQLVITSDLATEVMEARSKALDEAAELAKKQAQVFRDDAHDQKQLGNRELHKRALVIASFFDAHAIAVAALKDTQT